MEQKRPALVIVCGTIGIIIGLVFLYSSSVGLIYFTLFALEGIIQHRGYQYIGYQDILWKILAYLPHLTIGISFIISVISIFKLKNWGRILFLWLMVAYFIIGSVATFLASSKLPIGIYVAFFLWPSIASIYYLTSHKVKGLFK